jgi:hypothetical protein
MGRKKKIVFKLSPEWMLKEPLDFEYNKYTLLDYIQKCEKNLDNFEIYPDFVELSLHLANMQSLYKENTLLLTNKKFESCDDEIMIKDLYPKKPREMSKDEEEELQKTLKFSNTKLFDTFNFAKSIWDIAFNSVELSIKKNKGAIISGMGYVFYYRKSENKVYVWEYQIKKNRKNPTTNKTQINKIFEDAPDDVTLTSIIENNSSFKKHDYYKGLPIFEMNCTQDLPMEQTIIPIMKRKITSYIFQTINLVKTKNFDSNL